MGMTVTNNNVLHYNTCCGKTFCDNYRVNPFSPQKVWQLPADKRHYQETNVRNGREDTVLQEIL